MGTSPWFAFRVAFAGTDSGSWPGSAKPAKEAKGGSKKASKAAKEPMPREGSKKQIVLDLLRRKDGATMTSHSIRGFISGRLNKMGLAVESTSPALEKTA